MAVDFHAHLGRPDPEAPPFLRHMFDVDGYLEKQAAAGIELTVLSYTLADHHGAPEELERAKAEHAFIADLVARHPGRFAGLATVDPFGGAPWLEEAERALDAGFRGLCFPTSRQGAYLDAPEAEEAFAFADERAAVVFVHPSESALQGRSGDRLLEAWIGLPCDTGVCLSRMLLADTLARYSNVRMVVAHAGGVLTALLGRVDPVYEVTKRMLAMTGGGGPPDDRPPPSERLSQLYLDTASPHPATLRAAVETVGADRVVLGTDYPPAGESPAAAMAAVDALGLTEEEREGILSRNARALLLDD